MMYVKIKVPAKDTIGNDPYMRTHPCFITIKGDHNHHTVFDELRVIKAAKEEFFKYFDLGMCYCFTLCSYTLLVSYRKEWHIAYADIAGLIMETLMMNIYFSYSFNPKSYKCYLYCNSCSLCKLHIYIFHMLF